MKLTKQVKLIEMGKPSFGMNLHTDTMCEFMPCPDEVRCVDCVGQIPIKLVKQHNPDMSTEAVRQTVLAIKVLNITE